MTRQSAISFDFLPKESAKAYFPVLFDILYNNMKKIAPSGAGYEEDYRAWYGAVLPAFVEKEQRKILLIRSGGGVIGFFQYYVNETTFMMEEIQFAPAYQGTGVFQKLFAHLACIIPGVPFVESFAHKENTKSQGILTHLGLQIIGEDKDLYHFRGDCRSVLGRYKKEQTPSA